MKRSIKTKHKLFIVTAVFAKIVAVVFTLIVTIAFTLLVVAILITNLKSITKNEKYKDVEYYYNYYEDNKEYLNNLIEYSINNNIAYISTKKCIVCSDYQQKEYDDVYFYTNEELDESNIYLYTSFFKKSELNEIYLTSSDNYYILALEQENRKLVFFEYCINNCNYKDEVKEEQKKQKKSITINRKIDNNWLLVYKEIK